MAEDTRTDFEKRIDTHQAVTAARAMYHTTEIGQVAKLKAMVDELDRSKAAVDEFVKERNRLGETDANAGAIINLSNLTKRLSEMLREHMAATLDLHIRPPA